MANYQGRTKSEEHRFGPHSLYKLSYLPINAKGFEADSYKCMLSFYNRTNPKKGYENLKGYVERTNVKMAYLIDNQTDDLLEVYQDGVWKTPTEAQILNHNSKSFKKKT
jgi:hypothetical protein